MERWRGTKESDRSIVPAFISKYSAWVCPLLCHDGLNIMMSARSGFVVHARQLGKEANFDSSSLQTTSLYFLMNLTPYHLFFSGEA